MEKPPIFTRTIKSGVSSRIEKARTKIYLYRQTLALFPFLLTTPSVPPRALVPPRASLVTSSPLEYGARRVDVAFRLDDGGDARAPLRGRARGASALTRALLLRDVVRGQRPRRARGPRRPRGFRARANVLRRA